MDVEKIIRQYLPTANVMQIATSQDGQPWVCSVHYYSDADLNLYWLSTPDRRHSKEISQNPKTAATIAVHVDTPEEKYLVGLSLEGNAELPDQKQYDTIADGFGKKHGTNQKFLDSVKDGTNPHRFYKFTPTKIVLFDTKNFPNDARQEWKPGAT